MTKKEVRQKLFSQISNTIESFDFKTDIKNEYFVRRTPESVYVYDILFYDRTVLATGEKGFLIEPYIWINVKEIEKYYKEITLNKELKRDTDFKILGEGVAEIIANPGGIHKKWNESLDLFIFNETDISKAAKELKKRPM